MLIVPFKAQYSNEKNVGSVKIVLEGDLGVVDCYTGSDTGVIFLSEAAVINLTDSLQRRLQRLAQVYHKNQLCVVSNMHNGMGTFCYKIF